MAVAADTAGTSDKALLQVGPGRRVKTLREAAALCTNQSFRVEVDAGDYARDVAVWDGFTGTIQAVGGRVRLHADGESAESKAIWVMRRGDAVIEGIDFNGARVKDANGAGIRFESGRLVVQRCRFLGNENGILTGNDGLAQLSLSDCEFGHNGHGDGRSHNLYAGNIASLVVEGCWFHHALRGHLLKSRARHNLVSYNCLMDGADGLASYELEFPNGGDALVLGNILQQAPGTQNPHLLSFGAEGYTGAGNRLTVVNNSFIDDRPTGGVVLRVRPGDTLVRALNNLVLGGQSELSPTIAPGDYQFNQRARPEDFEATPDRVRLRRHSPLVGRAVQPGTDGAQELRPVREFRAPTGTRAREDRVLCPGALAPLPHA